MNTGTLIEFLRTEFVKGTWVTIFAAAAVIYSIYSFVGSKLMMSKLKKRKKTLEQELDSLNAQLEQQTKQLEEELNRKDAILDKGKG